MIETLAQFFRRSKKETSTEMPAGLCPNCWGNQQYDNVIREMYVDKQIDVNNHEANHSFIKEFVVNKIEGIKLIKGNNGFECPTCKTIYPKK